MVTSSLSYTNPTSGEGRARGLGGAWRTDKVQSWHYERLAIVYVRQSDPHQVLTHQESTRVQYGLAARATDLGWRADRVLVIDDDLGKSGTTTEGRTGFQRLVSEVSLDHVGIILGVEMSRLARSCKDWYQLLELCALFGTLLADLDGIYDPAQYNDRLLLGLKGTMSEAELHIMQQRLRQGLLAKARRGELALVPPMGYVQRAAGDIVLDPDEQVQAVIRLIFRKFAEVGTVHALLRYLVAHQIQLGMRAHSGPERGEVVWRRPSRVTLQNILKHPMYAGAYVYGRRPVDPRRKVAGRPDTGRVVVPSEEWQVLLRDRVPAYISWAQYEQNLARLQANRARADTLGVAREGPALLGRLLVCAYCDRHMAVSYKDATHYAYTCARMSIDYGGERCQQLAGTNLDAFVSRQVLAALEPAALDLSLEAATHVEQERRELDHLWQQKVERARYEAERAGRQYRLVEPENRLVARHLEREWEEQLAAQLRREEEYRRFREVQPRGLSAEERAAIRQLAADIPALWQAPTTTAAERKEIVRQVVRRVVVAVQGESERVEVTIEWVGGTQTMGAIVRPVARFSQLSYYAPLRAQVAAWAAAGVPSAEMARRLNAAGYRPPKRCARFTGPIVQDLLRQVQRRETHAPPPCPGSLPGDEWWLGDLARTLGMPPVTLYHWLRRGWLTARQEQEPPRRWIVRADATEVARLRALHQRPAGYAARRRWIGEGNEGDGPDTAEDRSAHEAAGGSASRADGGVG
jgi:DNA invertase Pin-like site-specific DNA recombinase